MRVVYLVPSTEKRIVNDNGESYLVIFKGRYNPVLKIKLKGFGMRNIPYYAEIDGEAMITPRESIDERIIVIGCMTLLSQKSDCAKTIEIDTDLTTATIVKSALAKRKNKGAFETILAFAAIFSEGDKIVSTDHSGYRKVISYNGENVVSENINPLSPITKPHY